MKTQELANKIAQLKALVKENTNTVIKGFYQFSRFMNEPPQGCSKQPNCSKLDESKCLKAGNQSAEGYDPLHLELYIQKFIQQYGYNTQLDIM